MSGNGPGGGGGESRVLSGGNVFERAGVSFSHVMGDKLPQSASNLRPEMAGASFEAVGLSLVFHPQNPFVPTTHCNVRFLQAAPPGRPPIWWFGGGFDLTPTIRSSRRPALAPHGPRSMRAFRPGAVSEGTRTGATAISFCLTANETRGVGGLFFDDL